MTFLSDPQQLDWTFTTTAAHYFHLESFFEVYCLLSLDPRVGSLCCFSLVVIVVVFSSNHIFLCCGCPRFELGGLQTYFFT